MTDPAQTSALDTEFTTDAPFVVEPWPTVIDDPGSPIPPEAAPAASPVTPSSTRGGELQVLDPGAGELVQIIDATRLLSAAGIPDLKAATDDDLARFHLHTDEVRKVIGEAQGMTSDEIVDRLDLSPPWTRHGRGYTITASSPEAGTKVYDTDKLLAAVTDGVKRGVISQEAADAAVEPVRPDATVPYDLLRRARAGLANELTAAAEALVLTALDQVLAGEPKPRYVQRPQGIKRLLKLPAMKAAVIACRVDVKPPKRKAKVTQVNPDAKGA
jgi:hypothetical protein